MELLYILLVLLVVTRGCAAAAVRFGQPALVGELIAGILLGMTANAFPRSLPVLSSLKDDDVFLAIADLGVFFLMLLGGLELRPNQLIKASLKSTVIAVLGMLIPFSCGFSFAWWILPESEYHFAQSIFAGTALSITAV
ncbi:MAG: cation:proton antiporter, partial [Bdellovibrionales bacterium]|nr:cation:proton antiporter [Bdellovibrionales bacterium]